MKITHLYRAVHTPLVLMPSYNSGAKLSDAVMEACSMWRDVWVVIDGSNDGSSEALVARARHQQNLRIIRRPANGGKGAAVLDGLRLAAGDGYTHVLIMDADGQHPASAIQEFISASQEYPEAMILGQPVFDDKAPRIRVIGRRLGNVLTRFEAGQNVGDSLFGFRIYPLAALLHVMQTSQRMRQFDFDTEALVRLAWSGVPMLKLPVPVSYFKKQEGGISHFRYGRDNLHLAVMHARLMGESLRRADRGRQAARKHLFFEKKNQKTFVL